MLSWVRSQKLERFTDEYSAQTFSFETKPNSFRRQSYCRTELSASPPGENAATFTGLGIFLFVRFRKTRDNLRS